MKRRAAILLALSVCTPATLHAQTITLVCMMDHVTIEGKVFSIPEGVRESGLVTIDYGTGTVIKNGHRYPADISNSTIKWTTGRPVDPYCTINRVDGYIFCPL